MRQSGVLVLSNGLARLGAALFILLFLSVSMAYAAPDRAGEEAKAESAGPKVLFMIAEQNIEDKFFVFWWSYWRGGESEYIAEVVDVSATETKLKELFAKSGFHVIDPAAVAGEIEIEKPYRVVDLTLDGVKYFGTAMDADVVVKGKAIAREVERGEGSNLGLYMADVTASAIRVEDGRVLAAGSGHGTSRHLSRVSGAVRALEKASESLARELMEGIKESGEGR